MCARRRVARVALVTPTTRDPGPTPPTAPSVASVAPRAPLRWLRRGLAVLLVALVALAVVVLPGVPDRAVWGVPVAVGLLVLCTSVENHAAVRACEKAGFVRSVQYEDSEWGPCWVMVYPGPPAAA